MGVVCSRTTRKTDDDVDVYAQIVDTCSIWKLQETCDRLVETNDKLESKYAKLEQQHGETLEALAHSERRNAALFVAYENLVEEKEKLALGITNNK